MYQLFYYPNNASLAPHLILRFVQAEYELVLIDKKLNRHKTPEYLKLNPAGRIPTLIDNDQAIFESPAICIHLCEQFPNSSLIPPIGSKQRPLFFQWLTYLNNTLQTQLMVRYYPERNITDQLAIPALIQAQDVRIAESLAVIDEQLVGNTYLLGEQLTACDFFLFMLAGWCLPVEKSPLHFKHLSRYLANLASHPTIVEVAEIEAIDLTPFKQ
ncbi:glutathione S-transferase family protein [Vibrio sp. LaRot3]|uniref:glutathione S-transferase family protein n=1 Tax=Vibrio sp. LaRot3 TaxID=2998829 RepID=UPI0022CE35B2|nr:glutathione S-transferase family protein [Vibrio sp. LaRot3]MDA0148988.1 glutathione S-transferase family protein [Vibrio sp. LaRot3]